MPPTTHRTPNSPQGPTGPFTKALPYPTPLMLPHLLLHSRSVLFLEHTISVSRSVVSNCFAIPWGVAHQAPLSMEFSQQESWSGLPFPSPEDLQGSILHFLCLLHEQADSLPLSHLGSSLPELGIPKHRSLLWLKGILQLLPALGLGSRLLGRPCGPWCLTPTSPPAEAEPAASCFPAGSP